MSAFKWRQFAGEVIAWAAIEQSLVIGRRCLRRSWITAGRRQCFLLRAAGSVLDEPLATQLGGLAPESDVTRPVPNSRVTSRHSG